MNILQPEIYDFLRKNGHSFEIQKIPGEASTRVYYRILYENCSRILCIDEKLDSYENPFLQVQDFLSKNNFKVPEIIDIDLKKRCILQSDVGSKDLTSLDQTEYEKYVKFSLNEIIRLQELQPISIIQSRSFDFAKLSFEIDHTISVLERFREKNLDFPPFHPGIYSFFVDCIQQLASFTPKVICHRDFHARNIMIDDHNQIYWIDFQDMMMGTPQYDLVSILYDAYKPLSIHQREDFYTYFKESSIDKDKRYRENYLIQSLQRSFKALGTYFVMFHDKGKHKYKESILPCLQNIIEITQLGKFPDGIYLYFMDLKKYWEDYLTIGDMN